MLVSSVRGTLGFTASIQIKVIHDLRQLQPRTWWDIDVCLCLCRQITQNSGFMSLRSRAVLVKGAQANNSMARIDPFASLKSPAPHRIA